MCCSALSSRPEIVAANCLCLCRKAFTGSRTGLKPPRIITKTRCLQHNCRMLSSLLLLLSSSIVAMSVVVSTANRKPVCCRMSRSIYGRRSCGHQSGSVDNTSATGDVARPCTGHMLIVELWLLSPSSSSLSLPLLL